MLKELADSEDIAANYDHVCLMLDQVPIQKKRHTILSSLKRTLRIILSGSNVDFSIMAMASKSDLALQAVDYYSWALFRKWESGDSFPLAQLGNNIAVFSLDSSNFNNEDDSRKK